MRGFHVRGVIFVLVLLEMSSCTKEYPLEPILSDDTNWTPSLMVLQNDYRRIQAGIETVPRKELLRNISFYTLTIKQSSDSSLVELDTLSGTYAGLRPSNPPYYWSYFNTQPVLEYNTEYTVELTIHYRQGISRNFPGEHFLTPLERGTILKSIPLPSGYGLWYGDQITFVNGSIILLSEQGALFSIDTANGQITNLTNSLFPIGTSRDIPVVTASRGLVLTPYRTIGDWNRTTILRYDPNAQTTDTNLVLLTSDWHVISMAGDTDRVMVLLDDQNQRQRFISLDPLTGDTLQTFPVVPPRPLPFLGMAFDGSSIWVPNAEEYYNTLIVYDTNDLGILRMEKNPVFRTHGLTWDGNNFWVVDEENQTICKLQLGGL